VSGEEEPKTHPQKTRMGHPEKIRRERSSWKLKVQEFKSLRVQGKERGFELRLKVRIA